MTVREYIGARYVPEFMGEWDDTVSYEPLSIVTYQGDSYTSRQSVPIGVSITNTAYWAITGNYNAQVEAYRQEVLTVKDALPIDDFSSSNTVKDYVDAVSDVLPIDDFSSSNTVKDYVDAVNDALPIADFSSSNTVKDYVDATATKHLVVIGDSFSNPTYVTEGNMWYTIYADQKNLVKHVFADNGCGYVQRGLHLKTFSDLLDDAIADTSFDHGKVSEVIIFGGVNDINGNCYGDSWESAIQATITKARTNFSRATIIVAGITPFPNQQTDDNDVTQRTYANKLSDVSSAMGVKFIPTSLWLFAQLAAVVEYGVNNHPNELGNRIIASSFLSERCRHMSGSTNFTSVTGSTFTAYNYEILNETMRIRFIIPSLTSTTVIAKDGNRRLPFMEIFSSYMHPLPFDTGTDSLTSTLASYYPTTYDKYDISMTHGVVGKKYVVDYSFPVW